MTHKEITQLVQENPNQSPLNDFEVNFNFSHLDIVVPKKGIIDIHQYLSRLTRGWSKIEVALPTELEQSRQRITAAFNSLEGFIKKSEGYNVSQLKQDWRNLENQINSFSHQKILITESPITTFLLDVFKVHGQKVYYGALKYLLYYNQGHSYSSPEELTGAFLAFEYKFQENSIKNRRRQEKSSLSKLRNEFENHFTKVNQNLSDQFSESQQKVQEISLEFDELLQQKKQAFENWFSTVSEEFQSFHDTSKNSMAENEKLYKEQLKFEAPAAFWQKRATKLKEEGDKWLQRLLISSGIGVAILIFALFLLSNGTLDRIFDETGSAIKWTVGFITLVSFLAYAIKTFAKLTFSSYHLFRDAEEREQLAYVYLALKKDKNIDETERHLVMQSLFSRADYGLLGNDNSPTMPGNIVDKFLAKN